MNKITIHIGLHKTGTTFLQNNLLKNIPNVSLIRGWYSHRELIGSNEENHIIISDEAISGRLWHEEYNSDFYTNIKKIKKIYGNPKIIFGIRNQVTFIPSVYKQYLNEQGFREFDFLFNLKDKGLRKFEDFLLIPKINHLKDNFDDVFIYSQESLLTRQSDFINSLESFLELEQKIGEPNGDSKENVGVKTEFQINTLRKLNSLSHRLSKISRHLSLYSKVLQKLKITPRFLCQNYLRSIRSKKFEIPLETKEFIGDFYENDWSEAKNSISY